MGLDSQTMMLVQANESGDRKLVLMFDIYTLDKITELYVNIWNPVITENDDYDESWDFGYPNVAESNKTDASFPRISWWNNGSYILVGVGAHFQSKIYPEFRIYNTESK